jgi:hypothetical protein
MNAWEIKPLFCNAIVLSLPMLGSRLLLLFGVFSMISGRMDKRIKGSEESDTSEILVSRLRGVQECEAMVDVLESPVVGCHPDQWSCRCVSETDPSMMFDQMSRKSTSSCHSHKAYETG